MHTRGLLTMVMTSCVLTLMCPLASGQTGNFPAPPYLASLWKFDLEPSLWLTAMQGDVTVRGRTADVDLDLDDTLDLVFESLKFAVMGRFEARKGNLLFTLDLNYINLEEENTTAVGLETEVTSKAISGKDVTVIE
jgi:hypothetical protein